MTSFPVPSRSDHKEFCETEGWTRVRNSRGKTGTHHVTYELALPDGNVLRTRISHPPDDSGYGKGLWHHILTEQLIVTEDEFWTCVRDGKAPDRGLPERPRPSVPAPIVHQLIVRFYVPETEVAAMTKQDAIERLTALWSASE